MFLLQGEDENDENTLTEINEFEIELTGEGLTKLPESLYKKNQLVNLYVSSNFIKILPPKFFEQMKMLKVIHFSYNKLTSIPSEISELTNLEILLLDHNSINEISSGGLECCKKLKKLDLSFNNISILPQNEFSNLPLLNVIKLSNNPIEKMNEKLSSIVNAKELTDILKSLEFNPNESKLNDILEHEIDMDFLEEQNYDVEVDLSEIPTLENSVLMARYQKSMGKTMAHDEEEDKNQMILSKRRTRKPGLKTLDDILSEDELQKKKELVKKLEKVSMKQQKKKIDFLIQIDEKLIGELAVSDSLIKKRQDKMKFGCSLVELIEYEEKKNSFFQNSDKIEQQIQKINELLEDLQDTTVYPPGMTSMIDDLKSKMGIISSLVSIFEEEQDVKLKMEELNEKVSKIYSIFDNKPKFRRTKQKAVVPSKSSVIIQPTTKSSIILPPKASLIAMDKPKKVRRSQIIDTAPPKIEENLSPDDSKISISRRIRKTKILSENPMLQSSPILQSPSPIEAVTPIQSPKETTISTEPTHNDVPKEIPIVVEPKEVPMINVVEEVVPLKDISNIEKTNKKSIGEYGKTLRRRVRDDNDLALYLTSNEKNEINFGIHELLDWMEGNSNATEEEIEAKRMEMLKESEEIIVKATKKKLLDDRRKMKKRVEDEEDLGPYLTAEEKRRIDLTNQEFLDWMAECGDKVTKEEIEKKRRELFGEVESIIKKAESKKKLNDIGRKTRKRLEDEDDELSALNVDEKGRLQLDVSNFLDWMAENPNSKLEDLEKKEKEFLEILQPIETIAKSKKKLLDFGRSYKKRIGGDGEDDLGEYLTESEKKRIQMATEEFLNWMSDCDVTKQEEIEKKKEEILGEATSIIEKAKTKKKLNDFGRKSKKRVEDEDDLGPYLTTEEKRRIDIGTEEFLNWMKSCDENITPEEIEKKRREIFGDVEEIIKKAETKKKLKDFGRKLKKRIQNDIADEEDLTPFLTKDEKRIIDLSTQEFLDWMAENPNATEEEIKLKRVELLGEAERIMKLATKKRIQELGKKLKKRIEDDDDLGLFLTDPEKEKVEKDSNNLLDFIENIDIEDVKITEEEMENKKAEFIQEAEKLIKKAETKKSLTDFGRKVKKRIQDEEDLTEIEIKNKKLIKMEVIETLDWLSDYPDATEIEIISKDEEFRMKMKNFSVVFEEEEQEKVDEFEEPIEQIIHIKKKADNIFTRNQQPVQQQQQQQARKTNPDGTIDYASLLQSMDPMQRRNLRASMLNLQYKSNVQQKKMFYELITKKNQEDISTTSYTKKGSIVQVQKFQKVTTNKFVGKK